MRKRSPICKKKGSSHEFLLRTHGADSTLSRRPSNDTISAFVSLSIKTLFLGPLTKYFHRFRKNFSGRFLLDRRATSCAHLQRKKNAPGNSNTGWPRPAPATM